MPNTYNSYWDLIEPAWDDLCTGLDGPGPWLAAQGRHSRSVVILFAAHFCQSEVCNGGWLQFFKNSTGILGPEACVGFKAIGTPLLAKTAQRATTVLGEPYPRHREARWERLLTTSAKSIEELQKTFGNDGEGWLSIGRYLDQATKPLGFDALNKDFYINIYSENGGFEAAANRYAKTVSQDQP